MISPFRQFVSKCKTTLYRRPNEEVDRLIRWGPQAYFRCDAWAREMEAAAWKLPVIGRQGTEVRGQNEEGPPVSLWFLTGKRFWYQTAFCAWTFAKQSGREVVLNLVDDGTLQPEHEDGLRRLFPQGVTLRKEAVRERIETLLPSDRFPVLRQRWDDYIHIRKLTDIHLGSSGVKLVLDSDMLFFRRPDALLAWWDSAVGTQRSEARDQRSEVRDQRSEVRDQRSEVRDQRSEVRDQRSEVRDQRLVPGIPTSDIRPPTSSLPPQVSGFSPHPSTPPCLMTDCVESYGYSRALMEELAGARIPSLLNVGICGLRSEDLNWEQLEQWCSTLLSREGTSYYLEQALVAMFAARSTPVVMPREDYITFPSRQEIARPSAVLQHYVADSKPGYFGSAWRSAIIQ